MIRAKFLFVLFILFLVLNTNLLYAIDCESKTWVAKAISIQGDVERRSKKTNASSSQWIIVKRNDFLCAGEIVRVRKNSRAALILKNDTIIRLNQNTTISLSELPQDQSHWIKLERGVAHFIARIKQSFKVITPFVNAAVEGTEFVISADSNFSEVTVFEGVVSVKNIHGEVSLTSGQSAVVKKDAAPEIIIKIKPRNAVQWSVHYPVIFDTKNYLTSVSDINIRSKIKSSIVDASNGNISTALLHLDAIPVSQHDDRFHIYKATLYLSVGRIDKAQENILAAQQNLSNNAQALALQAIIAIVQNNNKQGLMLAMKAIATAPDSIEATIALSYVHQSMFNINKALQVIKKLITNKMGSALLYSRLAELYLMIGELEKAELAAKKANILTPGFARTHSILGFAYLSRIKVKRAEQMFRTAIKLTDSDPLSHLGLGLVLIRQGYLLDGRLHIEYATTLDPNNALIRSYLGKAYYEEKREELAAIQFKMAKQLDPNDPTAFYYNAIYLQSINRPVEALAELQRSKQLNNNRAVTHSQLRLDQDEAARSASKARIYNDIGFGQQALLEGWQSLMVDPTNSSAHRLLADSYSNLARHEIARVSELLQAQLLQPLNLNPIQPQLALTNLGILDGSGPSDSAYSEFNPLFTRNNINLQINTLLGTQETLSDDIVISGLHDRISYSLGQFYFKTKGYRLNNDIQHNIYNSFIQLRLTPKFNIQFENRIRRTEAGDLLLVFDPKIFSANKRTKIDTNSNRFGFHYQPSLKHDLLGSFRLNESDDITTDFRITPSPPAPFPVKSETIIKNNQNANSFEVQYIYNSNKLKWIIGSSNIDLKHDYISTVNQEFLPPGPVFSDSEDTLIKLDTLYTSTYIYSHYKPLAALKLTIGLSFDDYKVQQFKNEVLNPKLGILYKLTTNLDFRLAAFSTVKRPLITNQTIEPTNIAGFNQFFDDERAAETNSYGFAFDYTVSKYFKGTLEPSWRTIDVPVFVDGVRTYLDTYTEQRTRANLNYIVNNRLSITTEYLFENLNRSSKNIFKSSPLELKTTGLPITFFYANPSGFSAQAKLSFMYQKFKDDNELTKNEEFWITDLSASYRMQRRLGKFSIGIKNLFDKQFNFYDVKFTGIANLPVIQPVRSIFGKFTLIF